MFLLSAVRITQAPPNDICYVRNLMWCNSGIGAITALVIFVPNTDHMIRRRFVRQMSAAELAGLIKSELLMP